MPNPRTAKAPAKPATAEPGASLTDAEAEQQAIGIVLDSPFNDEAQQAIRAATAQLAPGNFSDPLGQAAWRSIATRTAAGMPVNLAEIARDIETSGQDGNAVDYLTTCQLQASAVSYLPHYLDRVEKAAHRRSLHDAARLAADALARGDALDDVAAALRAAGADVGAAGGGPEITSAADFAAVDRAEPVQIVHGVLRAGQIGILSASSKAGKTWSLMSAAFAVATGGRWFGWNAAQGRVLYINAELPDYDLESRLKVLCDALRLDGLPDGLDVWHLRGKTMTIPQLLPSILRRQRERGPYALIMPDPLYRFGQGRDENDNAVQALTMAELNELAERTTAAVLAAHHFSKGNKSKTDHLDRASGAGMFARAPDLIATLTSHEEADCYTLESTCRSFAKPDPVVVRWQYPLWTVADELDPERLKKTMGRPAKFSTDDLLDLLPPDGLTRGEWLDKAKDEIGIGKTRFSELVRIAKGKGQVVSAFGKYVRGGAE
ncbi:MAG: AAA family ATPase [Kiritimatiellia bacterium]|jgi:hypothetical protein|nr:AAA family ATPase [Kiritimatiellia bacterium]